VPLAPLVDAAEDRMQCTTRQRTLHLSHLSSIARCGRRRVPLSPPVPTLRRDTPPDGRQWTPCASSR
jgi:hypothetical protein